MHPYRPRWLPVIAVCLGSKIEEETISVGSPRAVRSVLKVISVSGRDDCLRYSIAAVRGSFVFGRRRCRDFRAGGEGKPDKGESGGVEMEVLEEELVVGELDADHFPYSIT